MAVEITECFELAYNHRVYTIRFFGTLVTTTVTYRHYAIRRWIESANKRLSKHQHPIVSLGVFCSYYAGASPAATLQLCVGHKCLVVQLIHTTVPPPVLREFLLNPNYTFVGFWNHFDPWRLRECSHRLQLARRPVDVRFRLPGMEWAMFGRIMETCLGLPGARMMREIGFSDWENPVLNNDQVTQATVRAHGSFRIGLMIRAWDSGNYRRLRSRGTGRSISNYRE